MALDRLVHDPRMFLLALAFVGFLPRPLGAQVLITREPVYALDARAIVGANRVIARTRFTRRGSSSMVRELAHAASRGNGALAAEYRGFYHERLVEFLRDTRGAAIRLDDAGDARALFIQAAFKVYNGQGFHDPAAAFTGPGLWGEGAIAGMARASSSLARFEFVERIKFLMGGSRRFAALSDVGKQRLYDFYAIAAELLIEGYRTAVRSGNRLELTFLRRQARKQLKADLGVDPDRVRFTAWGIEMD